MPVMDRHSASPGAGGMGSGGDPVQGWEGSWSRRVGLVRDTCSAGPSPVRRQSPGRPPFRFLLPCLRPLPTSRDEAVALGTEKLEPSEEQDRLTSMVSSSLGPLCRWS